MTTAAPSMPAPLSRPTDVPEPAWEVLAPILTALNERGAHHEFAWEQPPPEARLFALARLSFSMGEDLVEVELIPGPFSPTPGNHTVRVGLTGIGSRVFWDIQSADTIPVNDIVDRVVGLRDRTIAG